MDFSIRDSVADANELAEGQRKLKLVADQFREVRLGGARSVHCPYCDSWIPKPDVENNPADWIRPMESPWCCSRMDYAALAIIERMMLEAKADEKKRIEDRLK